MPASPEALEPTSAASRRRTSECVSLPATDWRPDVDAAMRAEAAEALERGDVLYFPHLPFTLSADEKRVLRADSVKPGSKTIKYDPATRRVWGTANQADEAPVKTMLGRYADAARGLLETLVPHYASFLKAGATSFRPVETEGRRQSRRHDDTLLHVDAFSSRPSRGERIVRVFTNIHPGTKPRVWRVGEPFETVAGHFLPKIGAPLPGSARLLRLLKVTKSERSPADHYMLKLHDRMKFDAAYQRDAPHLTVRFPPGSTWIVFTDQVSHAALSGQHALEQTFTLPVAGMVDPERSPLRVLERLRGARLT